MSSSRKRRLAKSDDWMLHGLVRQGDIREAARKSAQEAMAYARTRKGAARDADYQSKAAFLGASDRAYQLLVAWMDGRPYSKVEVPPKPSRIIGRSREYTIYLSRALLAWSMLRKLWILRGEIQPPNVTMPLAAQLHTSILAWMAQADVPKKEA